MRDLLYMIMLMPVLFGCTRVVSAQDLADYQKVYDASLAKITRVYDQTIKDNGDTYMRALDSLKQTLQNQGNLEGFLAVEAERRWFVTEQDVPDTSTILFSDMGKAQDEFRRIKADANAGRKDKISKLNRDYLQQLTSLQKMLQRNNRVAEAAKVNVEMERIARARGEAPRPRLVGGGSASGGLMNLVVYESFDYPEGPNKLSGRSGGLGFAGNWATSGGTSGADLFSPGLTYSDAKGSRLMTRGNSALMAASSVKEAQIDLSRRMLPIAGRKPITTIYVSFLAAWSRGDAPSFCGVTFHRQQDKGSRGLFGVGGVKADPKTGAPVLWSLRLAGGKLQQTDVTLTKRPSLAVLKIQINETGENETLSLYINPVCSPEPDVATLRVQADVLRALSDVERLHIRSGSDMLVDEIRVGTSWDAVTPHVRKSSSNRKFTQVYEFECYGKREAGARRR